MSPTFVLLTSDDSSRGFVFYKHILIIFFLSSKWGICPSNDILMEKCFFKIKIFSISKLTNLMLPNQSSVILNVIITMQISYKKQMDFLNKMLTGPVLHKLFLYFINCFWSIVQSVIFFVLKLLVWNSVDNVDINVFSFGDISFRKKSLWIWSNWTKKPYAE